METSIYGYWPVLVSLDRNQSVTSSMSTTESWTSIKIIHHWENDGVGVLRHGIDAHDYSYDVLDAAKALGPEPIRMLLTECLKTIDFHFAQDVESAKHSFEMDVRRRLHGLPKSMISKEEMIEIISRI